MRLQRLVGACSTVGLMVSGPWRGRLLDSLGLGRTLVPQLAILLVVWSIAPWVGYWLLVPLAFLGGLFAVPVTSIGRQISISAVQERQRSAALSLNAVVIDFAFIVGPVLGVLAAARFDTHWVLFTGHIVSALGGILICVLNPRLVGEREQFPTRSADLRRWMSPIVLATLAATVVSALMWVGSELAVVAAMRSMGHPGWTGWLLAVSGLDSILGALVYGGLKPAAAFVILILAAGTTLPLAYAPDRYWLTGLLFVAGLCCSHDHGYGS